MEYIINDREPEALFHYFEDICAIPHGSGNESGIADYIENFGKKHGLYVYRDANNNVLLRRPASKGYEDHAPVLVQGHIDMVCEAESWCDIDFSHDGLELRVGGDMLTANGTTLGADDGVAVAIMLALLGDENLCAPTIECLLTTEEETGLTGATVFDYSKLTARRMINLDTGGEVVIVSCAGGMRTLISSREATEPYHGKALSVTVDGLSGGHSGADIHRGRANANLTALALVKAAGDVTNTRIISMKGGSKDNAIPTRCTVVIGVDDEDAAVNAINDAFAELRMKMNKEDAGATVRIERISYDGSAVNAGFTERFIGFSNSVPCGVISMCDGIDMVETSQNYAVIEVDTDGTFRLCLSARSSVDDKLDDMETMLSPLAHEYGFEAETGSRYNGWAYDKNSHIRDAYVEVYRELTGREIPVTGIHAGLECGIIKRAVPDMDIIATGARTLGEHTTKEALDLNSLALVYKAVKELCTRL